MKDFFRPLDPANVRSRRFRRGAWDPFLSEYLLYVANRFSTNTDFYRDKVDGSVRAFFHDHNRSTKQSTIVALKGKAGIGKTSFLTDWLTTEQPPHAYFDANSLSSTDDIQKEVLAHCCTELRCLLNDSHFKKELVSRIAAIRTSAHSVDVDFDKHFINQSEAFRKDYPDFGYHHLLAALVSAASACKGSKVWLVLDNADLQSTTIQEKYFSTAQQAFRQTLRISAKYDWPVSFHVVVAIRNETEPAWRAVSSEYQCVSYKNKTILGILEKRLGTAIADTSREYGEQIPQVDFLGRRFERYSEIGKFIQDRVLSYLSSDVWPGMEHKGFDPDDWHLAIVNDDVRRLLNFWVHFLLCGNFLDLVFPEREGERASYYAYQRLLFRGRYFEFPGNWRFKANSEDKDSPIVVNLFEPTGNHSFTDTYLRENYFINVRILQYLHSRDHVVFRTLKGDLTPFFGVAEVMRSLKWLIWIRLVDEDLIGVRNIGLLCGPEEIELTDDARLCVSDSGRFYLDELLKNYEYIGAIAPTTFQVKNSLNGHPDRGYFHDDVTIGFADSLVGILASNLAEYARRGLKESFFDMFVNRTTVHPVRDILVCCANAIKAKAAFVRHMDNAPDKHLAELQKEATGLVTRLNSIVRTESLGG